MGKNKLREEKIKAYLERSKECKQLKAKNDYRILLMMWLRFLFFGFIILGVYFGVKYENNIFYTFSFVSFVVLLFAVKKHQKVKDVKAFLVAKSDLNTKEVEILESRYHFKNEIPKVPSHDFFNDLQLSATGSLVHQVDRCISVLGRSKLMDKVMFFNTDAKRIKEDQEIIEELKDNIELRQNYWALQSKYELEELDVSDQWFEELPFKELSKSHKWGAYVMIAWSWLALGAYAFSWITEVQLFLAWSVSLIHISFYLKQVRYMNRYLKMQYKSLMLYQDFIALLRDEKMQHPKLKAIHQNIFGPNGAEKALLKVVKDLDAFENRNNLLIGLLLNALFQWDLIYFEKFKSWVQKDAQVLQNSLSDLHELEAYFSLANFSFNHDEFHMPQLNDEVVLDSKELVHFDLFYKDGVPNDLKISNLNQMLILTGANMSGKSTFLRTIGISWVLAHIGLKVPATQFVFRPMSLFTSMNNEDSLESSTSYFHAELSRLKKVYDKLEQGEEVFLLLDEILRGTNSKDKAEGSERFLRKIVHFPVSGIIATHDLSLTELEIKQNQHFFNKSFDVYFEGEEIKFDYLLKDEASTHLNATYLLEKMNLI